MAISKVIYKSSPSDTGTTWMDVTGKTVTSASMLNGVTALKNDGTDITGDIASKSSSDLTASGATVTVPSGYYASNASKSVSSGTEGTPTATKGTVSNHSVSVTPSVTNTTGYITGSTKTGTAVTVSASELVSGSETKTANGTYDVTNLAELVVNVSGGGGASNVVTGTFKGTTTGAAMDVTLNYTGSGYPVAAVIYPSDGVRGNNTFNTLVQRYVAAMFCVTKASAATVPQYNKTANVDEYVSLIRYKSSASSSTSYSQTGSQGYIATGGDAISNSAGIMYFKSKTKMSVFIANTSYGFAANIEYKYWVIYSS